LKQKKEFPFLFCVVYPNKKIEPKKKTPTKKETFFCEKKGKEEGRKEEKSQEKKDLCMFC
jgi:hypothetical protein